MIEETEEFFVLKLNPAFYDLGCVKEAFEELNKNTGSHFDEDEYFILKIRKSKDSKGYGYEFLNFVLKLMKEKGIV